MTALGASLDEKSELTDAVFRRVARLAKENWGLNLEDGKRPLVTARLWKRVIASGAGDFPSYIGKVEDGDQVECDHFISALTTNVTHFFREQHHFDLLESSILPRFRGRGPLRIWSAGCSSGQEPYSIAASVRAVLGASADARILATDVDPDILERAQKAVYTNSETSFPNPALEARVFDKKHEEQQRAVRANLVDLITFRRLNLIQPWPISGRFDVIFCRNVAIYFDKPTQANLWAQFAAHLNPNGFLFIGHSERIETPEAIGLCPAGITTYQKQ
ncbi:protein-glutamate O-methyltransferase CheR [Donghicola sp. XS_ASV15]|uniref:CheR family methyltransferase n=1 Tax=Donghicola sp. XS_ASV15 TaxID=3241295 RepID=UPI003511E7C2